ncbi:GAF domain-containing sensor histidine kinase [Guptibacillus hwajinpoensis]|uniref:GAF domain-containing sensor histidine kinase n=1 Tax=Guptibacillus hwajinpoensis TaxID=208199 RepID=UPI001CFEB400|nr:GAF domain-containing sensor histidine kinase [Pseudalkalibacillus hwajinpoensis]
MEEQRHERELLTLKTIAETLNRSTDLKPMLQAVLEDLLSVTGLKTGWIFLSPHKSKFTCEADVKLPAALAQKEKEPMCNGTCWCLNKYWDGRLNQAVNIIECKRLEDALHHKTGDTEGLTHHATVPLTAAGESFGLLNVGSPGKETFSDEELTLLESVAFQIGTAIKRIRLYQDEQKRAENYINLGTLTRELWRHECADEIISAIVQHTGQTFNWPFVGYFSKSTPNTILHSFYKNGEIRITDKAYSKEAIHELQEAARSDQPVPLQENDFPIHLEYPVIQAKYVMIRDEEIGILFALHESFSKNDGEILQAVADHMALAIEQARVNDKRQELILAEERNRLARDLHDSVSQKLFSLSMTARGAQNIPNVPAILNDALKDIQHLSQEAMQEMRTLIWQLRPVGIEAGLMTSLKSYAVGLGLNPNCDVSGFKLLPRPIEEALFRIGQESLNNVQKHAGIADVTLHLLINEQGATLTIVDTGNGFNQETVGDCTLGLRGMKERAALLGGSLSIFSKPKSGTKVQVRLPL